MSSVGTVEELVLRWDEARRQGRDLAAEELCRACPEHLEEVRRQTDDLRAMYEILSLPPRDRAPPGDTVPPEAGRPVADDPSRPRIDGYEVFDEVGHGAMGVVYKARQLGVNRTVAIKVLGSGRNAAAAERARFRREAEAVGRLQHPHVVQVYGYGEQDGCPYLCLEWMDGGTLARRVNGRPLRPRSAAKLVQSLARAMHAAHEAGVVHRDLKPGNVLLSRDGVPKVADFGLAKLLDGGADLTRSGAAVGTPSYMAPEQVRGRAGLVGPRTDVYALGAVLYELLTGRPPFHARTPAETLLLVETQEPAPVRRWQPKVSRDLEAVCLKCLEKRPARRYASAEELADDLGRWLHGAATRARPSSWPVRTGRGVARTAVRYRVPGLLAVIALLVLVVYVKWPRPPDGSSGAEWRAIQKEIADLAPRVALLREDGAPRAARCELGTDTSRWHPSGDGALVVETSDLAFLELLPDPICPGYVFRARVLHSGGTGNSQVGIGFLANTRTDTGGKDHCVVALAFADRGAYARKGIGTVALWYGRRVEHARKLEAMQPFPRPRHEFSAGPGQWRELAVKVTQQTIETCWQGVPTGAVGRGEVTDHVRRKMLVTPLGPGKAAEFADVGTPNLGAHNVVFREVLGLFVHQGSASFRDVAVEPLWHEP